MPRPEGTADLSRLGGPRSVQPRVRRRPPLAAPVSPRFLRGYVDLALTGVLEYERFGDLRAAPWGPPRRPPRGGDSGTRWEREVLEVRRDGELASWATLGFVVGSHRPPHARADLLDGELDQGVPLVLSIRDRIPPVHLEVHPVRERDRREAATFLWDLVERFRRQLD